MKNFYFILLSFTLTGLFASEQPALIKFKENKKQWPSDVKFMGEFFNGRVFLEKNAFVYDIVNAEKLGKAADPAIESHEKISGHVYKTLFINSTTQSVSGEEKQSEYYNYFLGNDLSKWSSHINAYKKVKYTSLYKGIDMHVYSEATNFKYDLIVSPNTDPEQIALKFEGIEACSIQNKNLVLATNAGIITENAPIAYQIIKGKKVSVLCEYILENTTVTFGFPSGYDKNYALIIDPLVVAATYSGSTILSIAEASAYDTYGNAYLSGSCLTTGFPMTPGAYDTIFSAVQDMVFHKFNSKGTELLFSTYIGGSNEDRTFSINIHKDAAYIYGYTRSTDFPVTAGAFDVSYNGGSDLVIFKMDTTGSILQAGTYVGGTGKDGETIQWGGNTYSERHYELAVDENDNVYAVGVTLSGDFPTTQGAYLTTPAITTSPSYDGVIFKMNGSLQQMIWSSYFGGSNVDCITALRLDDTGGVYFAGATKSFDFPVTTGVVMPVRSTNGDCFVSHISGDGSTLLSSTYIGTNRRDYIGNMTLDNEGNVLLYTFYYDGNGSANLGSDFVATPSAYNDPYGDHFIYKLNPTLSQYITKARFGIAWGTQYYYMFYGSAMEVDSCGTIYISRSGVGESLPTTTDAIKTVSESWDIYFCAFSKNATSLIYGSYYGGSKRERSSTGVSSIDKNGMLYLCINGSDLTPTNSEAYSPSLVPQSTTNIYFYDIGLLKIDMQTFLKASSYSSVSKNGCAPYSMSFVNQSPTTNVEWNFGDGSASVFAQDSVSHIYATPGTYDLLLIATDTSTCNDVDTLIMQVNVYEPVQNVLPDSVPFCIDTEVVLDAKNSGMNYFWSTGETTQTIAATSAGSYSVVVSNLGCSDADTSVVFVSGANFPLLLPNIITPNDDNVNDRIDLSNLNASEIEISVFDRWGKQVFQSDTIKSSWNGTVNGKVIDGTYFFTVKYKTDCIKTQQETKGFITVIK